MSVLMVFDYLDCFMEAGIVWVREVDYSFISVYKAL